MKSFIHSLGILYICTGDYYLFWPGFYESFEKNFLPDTIKNYYVFTDKPEKISQSEHVRAFYIDPLPWPLAAMMKFHYFIKFREKIIDNDYLLLINANLVCREVVHEEEFLPNDNQELSCVIHVGYYNRKACRCPYERNRKSKAYVPYNINGRYTFSGLVCGRSDKFMLMSEILSSRINEDFSNRIIAVWHDESHFNRYILEGHNVRLLSPSYLYPEGWNIPFEKKIEILNKNKFFDIDTFKGNNKPKLSLFRKIINLPAKILHQLITSHYVKDILYIRDSLLHKHL